MVLRTDVLTVIPKNKHEVPFHPKGWLISDLEATAAGCPDLWRARAGDRYTAGSTWNGAETPPWAWGFLRLSNQVCGMTDDLK
jgi:hypothetical protein